MIMIVGVEIMIVEVVMMVLNERKGKGREGSGQTPERARQQSAQQVDCGCEHA